VANAPMHVTLVKYSSDRRIKREIQSVDEDDLLTRINTVRIKSYKYSAEWQKVRNIKDVRVRGVIAQELEQVFPEYVTILPEFKLEDKNFTLKNFYQIDKTSLVMDMIAALEAQGKRFETPSPTLPAAVETSRSARRLGIKCTMGRKQHPLVVSRCLPEMLHLLILAVYQWALGLSLLRLAQVAQELDPELIFAVAPQLLLLLWEVMFRW
jgi:hypothetical protein